MAGHLWSRICQAFREKNPQQEVVTELICGNKNEWVVCVKNMDPEEVLYMQPKQAKECIGKKGCETEDKKCYQKP